MTGRQIKRANHTKQKLAFQLGMYNANKRFKAAIKTGDEAITTTLLIHSQVLLYGKAVTFPSWSGEGARIELSGMLSTMDELDTLFEQSHVADLHTEFPAYAMNALAFNREQERSQLLQTTREFVAPEGGSVGLYALTPSPG